MSHAEYKALSAGPYRVTGVYTEGKLAGRKQRLYGSWGDSGILEARRRRQMAKLVEKKAKDWNPGDSCVATMDIHFPGHFESPIPSVPRGTRGQVMQRLPTVVQVKFEGQSSWVLVGPYQIERAPR